MTFLLLASSTITTKAISMDISHDRNIWCDLIHSHCCTMHGAVPWVRDVEFALRIEVLNSWALERYDPQYRPQNSTSILITKEIDNFYFRCSLNLKHIIKWHNFTKKQLYDNLLSSNRFSKNLSQCVSFIIGNVMQLHDMRLGDDNLPRHSKL